MPAHVDFIILKSFPPCNIESSAIRLRNPCALAKNKCRVYTCLLACLLSLPRGFVSVPD